MSRGDKKKDRREYEKVQQQWIEMEDLKSPSNQELNKKFAIEEGKQYQPPTVKHAEPLAQQLSQPLAQPLGSSNSNRVALQREEVLVIKESRKKPSLPMTEVTCEYCTVPQSVPGNTQLYICGSCQNMNECYPLYGVVVCGCCQGKLGFGFGMSEYVKCPKCASLMKVPLEPAKNYQAVGRKENQRSVRERERERQRGNQEYDYVGFESERRPDLI